MSKLQTDLDKAIAESQNLKQDYANNIEKLNRELAIKEETINDQNNELKNTIALMERDRIQLNNRISELETSLKNTEQMNETLKKTNTEEINNIVTNQLEIVKNELTEKEKELNIAKRELKNAQTILKNKSKERVDRSKPYYKSPKEESFDKMQKMLLDMSDVNYLLKFNRQLENEIADLRHIISSYETNNPNLQQLKTIADQQVATRTKWYLTELMSMNEIQTAISKLLNYAHKTDGTKDAIDILQDIVDMPIGSNYSEKFKDIIQYQEQINAQPIPSTSKSIEFAEPSSLQLISPPAQQQHPSLY